MSATLTMPEESTEQQMYEMADEVMARMTQIDGVDTVGAMQSSGTSNMMGGSSSGLQFYILLADDRDVTNVEVKTQIEQAVKDLDCTLDVTESTMDLSMLGGTGLELVITGQDLDQMNAIAEDLRGILRDTEGVTDVSEKDVTGNPETRITVDKEDVYKRQDRNLNPFRWKCHRPRRQNRPERYRCLIPPIVRNLSAGR